MASLVFGVLISLIRIRFQWIFLLFISFFASSQSIDSLDYKRIDSLIMVARKHNVNEYENAIKINEIAESMAIKLVGKESVVYATCSYNRGRIYLQKGMFKESLPWLEESRNILSRLVDKNHSQYTLSLTALASAYIDLANYKQAESILLEVLEIKSNTYGKKHLQYAISLMNLATIYSETNQNSKCIEMYLEAILIYEQTLGSNHQKLARPLYNLGIKYYNLNYYEKANVCLTRALEIQKKTLGTNHQDYAATLNVLGLVDYKLYRPERAERHFLEALSIMEKTIGKNHPEYAQSLNNLAVLQFKTGYSNLDDLIKIHNQVLEIREKTLSKSHPDYFQSLINLGGIVRKKKEFDKALNIFNEALTGVVETKGDSNTSYGNIINNLGLTYLDLGNLVEAEKYFLQGLKNREKYSGTNTLDYSESLTNLALLHEQKSDITTAIHYEKLALDVIDNLIGKTNDKYISQLDFLANLYFHDGNYMKVSELYKELIQHLPVVMLQSINYLSSYELQNYLTKFQTIQDRLFSFTRKMYIEYPSMVKVSNDFNLVFKEFQLEFMKSIKNFMVADSVFYETLCEYKMLQRTLSNEYTKVNSNSLLRDSIKSRINDIEKVITRNSSLSDQILISQSYGISKKLKPDEAIVNIIKYHSYSHGKPDSVFYAAIITRSELNGIKFIPLFEENNLADPLALKINDKSSVVQARLYMSAFTKNELSNLVWQPLAKELQDVKTIYYSPTGILHKINLNAVRIDEKHVLADRYKLIQLGNFTNFSSRNIWPLEDSLTQSNNLTVLLIGGVEYGIDSSQHRNADTTELELLTNLYNGHRGLEPINFESTDTLQRSGNWYYLKYTEKEITEINHILKLKKYDVKTLTGFNATEKAFKTSVQRESPKLIHISTHGYFFSDPEFALNNENNNLNNAPIFKKSDHPMIRSGLILAGANYAWKHGRPYKEGMEDGILTAYEISQMNLSNTELVVLSACETGLGDLQGNEGVFGLQRAFKIAGVKYLIMSLWSVPDKQTAQFMISFYKNWIEKKLSIPDAFRTTQKQMRSQGLDPYHWAGFILVE